MIRAVTFLALATGILLTCLGLLGIFSPDDFAALIAEVQKRSNVYFLAGLRVAIGVILLIAAGGSRTPFFLGTLGVLVILGGLISPFMAVPLRQSVQRWMAGGGSLPMQAWAGVVASPLSKKSSGRDRLPISF